MNKTRIIVAIITSVLLSALYLDAHGQELPPKDEESLPSPHKLILELEEALERTNQWEDCQLEIEDKVLDCVCLEGTENRVFARIYRVGRYVVEVHVRDVGGDTYFRDVWGDAQFRKNTRDVHHGLPVGFRKQYKDLLKRIVRPTPWYVKASGTIIVSAALIYGSYIIISGGL